MIIAPSMLSADFGRLDQQVDMINRSEADWFHLDIMDGLFVPNISYGFPVIDAIAKNAKKPMDAHLMIVDPDRYLEKFAELGVEYLSVHYEACTHLHRSLQKIKALGMKAGVALNPHTPVENLVDILPDADFVLIMSVNPGYGGQIFIENTLVKVEKLKRMIQERSLETLIEVDGGVNISNAALLAQKGTDILVAGNSVFSAADTLKAISELKRV
ncbi:MAG: ribulose-phosphate 3-epimerase [Bacteroidetes bacterium GWF2_41_61]|nr:MAG: ribulose-phosphate 3-epimerase [Bacteroidetes bacterium GWF2_41_61]OFY90793.1 MAG: ribulose-phosphate 3-epimerase [Bacteroidetes bacterium RIFOXYA12_FULL_40_10]